MPKFEFTIATNVRAHGTVSIEAATIEDAKAEMRSDYFDMSKEFCPLGGGDDDYDYDCLDLGIWLDCVIVDDDTEIELSENNLDASEIQAAQALEFVRQMSRFTTPEDEFADPDLDHEKNFANVEEMVADFDDERLCGEYHTFMDEVRKAREILGEGAPNNNV